MAGDEMALADRIEVASGQSASLPSKHEETACHKRLWVDYELTFIGTNYRAIVEELNQPRRDCPGFQKYEPGFSPEQHKRIQLETRQHRQQMRIALLGFLGALIGGLIGTLPAWFQWLNPAK